MQAEGTQAQVPWGRSLLCLGRERKVAAGQVREQALTRGERRQMADHIGPASPWWGLQILS